MSSAPRLGGLGRRRAGTRFTRRHVAWAMGHHSVVNPDGRSRSHNLSRRRLGFCQLRLGDPVMNGIALGGDCEAGWCRGRGVGSGSGGCLAGFPHRSGTRPRARTEMRICDGATLAHWRFYWRAHLHAAGRRPPVGPRMPTSAAVGHHSVPRDYRWTCEFLIGGQHESGGSCASQPRDRPAYKSGVVGGDVGFSRCRSTTGRCPRRTAACRKKYRPGPV